MLLMNSHRYHEHPIHMGKHYLRKRIPKQRGVFRPQDMNFAMTRKATYLLEKQIRINGPSRLLENVSQGCIGSQWTSRQNRWVDLGSIWIFRQNSPWIYDPICSRIRILGIGYSESFFLDPPARLEIRVYQCHQLHPCCFLAPSLRLYFNSIPLTAGHDLADLGAAPL